MSEKKTKQLKTGAGKIKISDRSCRKHTDLLRVASFGLHVRSEFVVFVERELVVGNTRK